MNFSNHGYGNFHIFGTLLKLTLSLGGVVGKLVISCEFRLGEVGEGYPRLSEFGILKLYIYGIKLRSL